jgi:hypothetical protein
VLPRLLLQAAGRSSPGLNIGAFPDRTCGKDDRRLRKSLNLGQLAYTLTADAEHPSNLREADQVVGHDHELTLDTVKCRA